MATINLITEIPGPKSLAIVKRREAATSRGAAKLTQLSIESAEGAVVHDVDGNTLLDFAGGIGVLAIGHCPPQVVDALKSQAEKLIHMCAIVSTYEPFVEVAELLNEVTPAILLKRRFYSIVVQKQLKQQSKLHGRILNDKQLLFLKGLIMGAPTSQWQ